MTYDNILLDAENLRVLINSLTVSYSLTITRNHTLSLTNISSFINVNGKAFSLNTETVQWGINS